MTPTSLWQLSYTVNPLRNFCNFILAIFMHSRDLDQSLVQFALAISMMTIMYSKIIKFHRKS